MGHVRQHHAYAETGKPSQEDHDENSPEPRKTDFDGPSSNRNEAPHREEKSGD